MSRALTRTPSPLRIPPFSKSVKVEASPFSPPTPTASLPALTSHLAPLAPRRPRFLCLPADVEPYSSSSPRLPAATRRRTDAESSPARPPPLESPPLSLDAIPSTRLREGRKRVQRLRVGPRVASPQNLLFFATRRRTTIHSSYATTLSPKRLQHTHAGLDSASVGERIEGVLDAVH